MIVVTPSRAGGGSQPRDFVSGVPHEIATVIRVSLGRYGPPRSPVLPMIMTTIEIGRMSDATLVAETKRVAEVERRSTADLLALLVEVENRRVYLALGYSSLFAFSTQALHLSEQAAYSRITAARAARRFPLILELLSQGALSLSSVGIIAPHLTDENADSLFGSATHKSTREVERLIASLHAQPDIPPSLRAVPDTVGERTRVKVVMDHLVTHSPESAAAPTPIPVPSRPDLAPIAAKRYLLKVTIGQETHDKLQRARALLRHAIPDGDPALILDRALTLLLERTERAKCGAASLPRSPRAAAGGGRHVPAAVKRAVWTRDAARCAFVGADGRCNETAFLEFHHVVPFAVGGATDTANLQLRCRAHNAHEASVYFGADLAAATSQAGSRD